jgi:hypothetical protein
VTHVLRRLFILLLVLVLPFQAVAGVFAPVCRHVGGHMAAPVSAMAAAGVAHCAMDGMSETPDVAPALPHMPAFCDDCGSCHHLAFSLFFVPVLMPAVAFSPVRVARDDHAAATCIPAQPERPPRSAAA